jgi:hypothetical protein
VKRENSPAFIMRIIAKSFHILGNDGKLDEAACQGMALISMGNSWKGAGNRTVVLTIRGNL